ncbi:N-acetylglucosamine kinase [Dendrosporobacter sp. 1207_IL3150]|uniref:N-acetylglucosamine kinase n=1 Tax=Dendrosporobacter sp. 1207_IL3150 TaxID=3084054 RepID=UPI002FD9546E
MKQAAVLAIDGGGTGCRAALCNMNGHIMAYAQGSSCNYHSIGVEKATENLLKLITTLVKNQALHINCVVLGLAGLDTKKDEATLTLIINQALSAANIMADTIYLCNDALLTLKGTVGQNNGVLIAAGTGSIAWGITKEGLVTRVGGWGYRVGDEGSGYSIGKAAIDHVLKSYDGREKRSGISNAILHALSLADEDELINWIYSSQFSVAQVAALTPIIVRLAEDGDHPAEKIIKYACQELENMAFTVIKKLNLAHMESKFILSGGVLKNSLVHRQLVKTLAASCPGLQVVDYNCQPICAALRHGLILIGVNNDMLLHKLSIELASFISSQES